MGSRSVAQIQGKGMSGAGCDAAAHTCPGRVGSSPELPSSKIKEGNAAGVKIQSIRSGEGVSRSLSRTGV